LRSSSKLEAEREIKQLERRGRHPEKNTHSALEIRLDQERKPARDDHKSVDDRQDSISGREKKHRIGKDISKRDPFVVTKKPFSVHTRFGRYVIRSGWKQDLVNTDDLDQAEVREHEDQYEDDEERNLSRGPQRLDCNHFDAFLEGFCLYEAESDE
jgi:hypothetical protein